MSRAKRQPRARGWPFGTRSPDAPHEAALSPADGVRAGAGTIARNAILLTGATIAARLATFALTIVLGRRLGVADFGLYGFALALSLILIPVADAGMTPYTIRETARDRAVSEGRLRWLVSVKLGLSAAVLAVAALVLVLGGSGGEMRTVVLVMLSAALCDGFSLLVFGYFQGREQMSLEAGLTTVVSIARAAGGIGLALATGQLVLVVAWLLATSVIQVGYAIWRLRRAVGRRARHRSRPPAVGWPTMLTMGSLTWLTMVYTRADAVLIGWILDERAVGLYTAAYALMSGLQIATSMIGTALGPVFARAHSQDPALFDRAWQEGVRAVTIIAVPLSLAACLLAGPIMSQLYGSDFSPAADALRVLVWTSPLAGLAVVAFLALRGAGHERWLLAVAALGTVVNVGLNVWLIGAIGIEGAAIMTVVTEVVVVGAFLFFGVKRDVLSLPRVPLLRLLVASAALAGVALALRGLPVTVSFSASLTAYGAVGALIGLFRRSDVERLRSLRRR